ncbi:MAG: hypothetical protein ACPG44_10275, partial [Polaribacter sp.]
MKYLKPLLFVCISILLFSCQSKKETVKTKNEKPNILFIFPDQFRNSSIGINNEDPVITPNLDKLGKEGMV